MSLTWPKSHRNRLPRPNSRVASSHPAQKIEPTDPQPNSLKTNKTSVRLNPDRWLRFWLSIAICSPITPFRAGLAACYIAGLPLFGNTLASDAIYATLFFGAFALAEKLYPWLSEPVVQTAQ